MKKFIALSVVMFASYGAFAEEQIDKGLVAPEPSTPASYFRSNEFSGGFFGGYLDGYGGNNQGMGNRAFGGGLESSYFYFKYLGLSVDGNVFNESPGDKFGGTVMGNLILRLPLDDYIPNFHFAPYVFGGVGKFYSEDIDLPTSMPGVKRIVGRSGTIADVGGGIEFRLSPNLGIFADAGYNFAQNFPNDFISTRIGIRYALPIFGQKAIDEETSSNKIPIIKPENADEHQNWAVHLDAVEVLQGQPGFHSPYEGAQSLFPNDNFRQTSDVDLFFGVRLWPGGEIYFSPEYYQGFGFAETHGLAAFPNSIAYKVGEYRGNVNITHIFFRQVWGFGGEQEQLEADDLQLAEKVDTSRFTLQVGRFAVTDWFDNNAYAHDPRGDFLNWAAVDALAFDYAADSLGYEEGLYLELNQKDWRRAGRHLRFPACLT